MKTKIVLMLILVFVLSLSIFATSCDVSQAEQETESNEVTSNKAEQPNDDKPKYDSPVIEDTEIKSETYSVEQSIAFANIDFSKVDKIIINSGYTGATAELTDAEDIAAVIDVVKDIEASDPISSRGYYGYSYSVTFICGEEEIFDFGILLAGENIIYYGLYETVGHHDYSCLYKITSGSYEDIDTVLGGFVN